MNEVDLRCNQRGEFGPWQRSGLEKMLSHMRDTVSRDLAEGRVMAFDGEFVFDLEGVEKVVRDHDPDTDDELTGLMGAYRAVIAGRPIGWHLPGVNLLPGPYRFYMTPHSCFIVGAEAPPPAVARREHQQRMSAILRAVQKLDEATLTANREGRLTAAQRRPIRTAPIGENTKMALFGVLSFGGGSLVVLAGAHIKGRSPHSFIYVTLLLSILSALLIPYAYKVDLAKIRGQRGDLLEGRVVSRVGRISKPTTFSLSMGEDTFDLQDRPALFAAVVPGHEYRAYLTPHGRKLLFLELAE